MGLILAVANQKGGVAKTTTVVTLGAALADRGYRVLLVDLDAQACLTYCVGLDADEVDAGGYEVLLGQVPAAQVIVELGDGVQLLPATVDLSAAEPALATRPDRERALRAALEPLRERYDVVIVDCSPSLGVLTINALAAADEVIVPMQAEMLSHRGVGQLLDTVADVRRLLNPGLRVRGLLPTMVDTRTGHARAVLADVGRRYSAPVLQPSIPRSIRFAEASAAGRSILRTSPRSAGARAYRAVADALVGVWVAERRLPRSAKPRPDADQPSG